MEDHDFWDELAAGYALHGLSADEETQFIGHLDSCEQCAASLEDHTFVAAQLGSIAHFRETDDDQTPSWELIRASILGPAETEVAVTAETQVEPERAPIADLAAHRRRYTASRRLLAAAAAVVVVAGGGVTAWQLTDGSSGNAHCAGSSTCHTIRLDAAGGTMAAQIVIRGNANVTVTPAGMLPAPAGKIYVLWQLPRDGRATPVVAFKAGSPTASATAALPESYAETSGFAVSEENAGATYRSPSNTLASGSAT